MPTLISSASILWGSAVAALALASVTDLRSGRIPNALSISTAAAGTCGLLWAVRPFEHVLAALATGALLIGLRHLGRLLRGKPGVGGGDIKLSIGLALLIGWQALIAFYLGCVLGAAYALFARKPLNSAIRFAPLWLAGALSALILQQGGGAEWLLELIMQASVEVRP